MRFKVSGFLLIYQCHGALVGLHAGAGPACRTAMDASLLALNHINSPSHQLCRHQLPNSSTDDQFNLGQQQHVGLVASEINRLPSPPYFMFLDAIETTAAWE